MIGRHLDIVILLGLLALMLSFFDLSVLNIINDYLAISITTSKNKRPNRAKRRTGNKLNKRNLLTNLKCYRRYIRKKKIIFSEVLLINWRKK